MCVCVCLSEWHPAALSSLVTLAELMKSEQLITETASATHSTRHIAAIHPSRSASSSADPPRIADSNRFPVRKAIMQMWRGKHHEGATLTLMRKHWLLIWLQSPLSYCGLLSWRCFLKSILKKRAHGRQTRPWVMSCITAEQRAGNVIQDIMLSFR